MDNVTIVHTIGIIYVNISIFIVLTKNNILQIVHFFHCSFVQVQKHKRYVQSLLNNIYQISIIIYSKSWFPCSTKWSPTHKCSHAMSLLI